MRSAALFCLSFQTIASAWRWLCSGAWCRGHPLFACAAPNRAPEARPRPTCASTAGRSRVAMVETAARRFSLRPSPDASHHPVVCRSGCRCFPDTKPAVVSSAAKAAAGDARGQPGWMSGGGSGGREVPRFVSAKALMAKTGSNRVAIASMANRLSAKARALRPSPSLSLSSASPASRRTPRGTPRCRPAPRDSAPSAGTATASGRRRPLPR